MSDEERTLVIRVPESRVTPLGNGACLVDTGMTFRDMLEAMAMAATHPDKAVVFDPEAEEGERWTAPAAERR